MSEVERFDIECNSGEFGSVCVEEPAADGEYVRHSDHLALLQAEQERRRAAEKRGLESEHAAGRLEREAKSGGLIEGERDEFKARLDAAHALAHAAETRIGELEGALQFYSDGFMYLSQAGWTRLYQDAGATARTALSQPKEEG